MIQVKLKQSKNKNKVMNSNKKIRNKVIFIAATEKKNRKKFKKLWIWQSKQEISANEMCLKF